jgi:tetratricopeptide (TPR) repeat protein
LGLALVELSFIYGAVDVMAKAQKTKILLVSAALFASCCVPPAFGQAAFNDMMQQGNNALSEGKYMLAGQFFEQALKSDPSSPEAHNQLGLCFSRRNMLLEAAREFKTALEMQENFLPALQNMGTLMYRQGDYNRAIDYYKKVLALNENEHDTLINLANSYRDRATYVNRTSPESDYREAIELYVKCLAQKPDSAPAHNNLGLCYLRLRRFAEAEKEVRQAIELKKDYAAAYYYLGVICQAQQKTPDAVAAYQMSLRYETVPQYIEGTRAKIRQLGLPDAGDTDHFSLGLMLLPQKKWAEAEREFRQALDSPSGKTAVAWNNLGYARSRQNKQKEAVDAYQQAVKLLHNFPAAHYNLGQSLFTLRDYAGAEKEYRTALDQTHGRYPLAHNALGIVLKQMGKTDLAMSQYKLALMQSGDTLPVIHYNLAVLYDQQGAIPKACEEYQLYVAQAPNGVNVPRAKERAQLLGQRP